MSTAQSSINLAGEIKDGIFASIDSIESLLPDLSGSRSEDYVKRVKELLLQAHEEMVLASRLI